MSHQLYWILYWDLSIETMNRLVGEAMELQNFPLAITYCKAIALRNKKKAVRKQP